MNRLNRSGDLNAAPHWDENRDHPHECECLRQAKMLALDAAQLRDEVWARDQAAIQAEAAAEQKLDEARGRNLVSRIAEDAAGKKLADARWFNRNAGAVLFFAFVMFAASCVMVAAGCLVWAAAWGLCR